MDIIFNKIPLRFSIVELDNLIITLLNNILNKNLYFNTKKYISLLDKTSYINDEDKTAHVNLITTILETVISQNIENKKVLLNVIDLSGKFYDKETEILNSIYNEELSEVDYDRIDKKISLQLKLSVIEKKASDFANLMNDIKSESYKDLTDLEKKLDAVETDSELIEKTFKNYREAIEENKNSVSLDDSSFLLCLNKIITEKRNPSSKIQTGIKMFNEMLNGGYENGRVYCALAPAKNWKSGFLLNSAIWAKRYNHLSPKDPTKKPIALYISLENSIKETIERIFAHCKGNDYKFENYSVEENAKILEECGVYSPNNNKELGLRLLYKPNKTVTVSDIESIIDDLNKNGQEVVFLVIDYIKRIKPSSPDKDLRLCLGDISDDLHVLALKKNIPILTAMQLNRNAIAELDNADTFEKKLNAIGRIGGSNVGESLDIIQNVDFAFTLIRTSDAKFSEEGTLESIDQYLNIKTVASRTVTSNVETIIQRFETNNGMRIQEDTNNAYSLSITNSNALIKNKISAMANKVRVTRT